VLVALEPLEWRQSLIITQRAVLSLRHASPTLADVPHPMVTPVLEHPLLAIAQPDGSQRLFEFQLPEPPPLVYPLWIPMNVPESVHESRP
jgi:hypothetical protein